MIRRLLIPAFILIIITLFFMFDVQQYLNIDTLKQQKITILDFYSAHPFIVIASIFLAYVVVSVAVPANAILTVTVGMIFGFYKGLLIASVAATVGATCAMLISRYLLTGFFEKQFPALIKSLNKGFNKQGLIYLLSLRLVPIAPYMMVNLAMGLTSVRVFNYALITYIGMFIILAVLVNAGTQISTIQQMSDITSPALMLSLALLAVVPLLMKFLLVKFQARQQAK